MHPGMPERLLVDPVGFAAGRPAFAVFRASTLAALC
jgi:hypothetical protein